MRHNKFVIFNAHTMIAGTASTAIANSAYNTAQCAASIGAASLLGAGSSRKANSLKIFSKWALSQQIRAQAAAEIEASLRSIFGMTA